MPKSYQFDVFSAETAVDQVLQYQPINLPQIEQADIRHSRPASYTNIRIYEWVKIPTVNLQAY
jgi:hypothetical protein